MKEPNDNIFNHIKEALRTHEEPYDEGAWERFAGANAGHKKTKVLGFIMWKWIAAAAAVIAGIILLPRLLDTGESDNTSSPVTVVSVPQNVPADSAGYRKSETKIVAELPGAPLPAHKNSERNIHFGTTAAAIPNAVIPSTVALPPNGIQPKPVTVPVVTPPGNGNEVTNVPYDGKPRQQVDFWRNKVIENKIPEDNPAEKDRRNNIMVATAAPAAEKRKHSGKESKWQPSLFISPVFGDLGVNMGYGFSLGYAINDKLKISSGVAHTKISASRSYAAGVAGPPGAAGIYSSHGNANGAVGATGATGANGVSASKPPVSLLENQKGMAANSYVTGPQQISTLQQIDGSVSGIDIPVEINYTINKKLYASAGISGLVVINDNRKYTYLDSRNEKVSVQSDQGSLKENRSVMFSQQNVTTEPIKTPYDYAPFLGFYNFSVGYKQKLSDKNAVSIEPFIKVPVKNAGQQGLNYTGTGVRLKFDL